MFSCILVKYEYLTKSYPRFQKTLQWQGNPEGNISCLEQSKPGLPDYLRSSGSGTVSVSTADELEIVAAPV
jgi:hypothetical protein